MLAKAPRLEGETMKNVSDPSDRSETWSEDCWPSIGQGPGNRSDLPVQRAEKRDAPKYRPRNALDRDGGEAAALQHSLQACPLEEADVWRSPGLAAPEIITPGLPNAEERVQSVPPIRSVRHGNDEAPSGTQYTRSLGCGQLRLEDVLQHLDADDNVKRVVWDW